MVTKANFATNPLCKFLAGEKLHLNSRGLIHKANPTISSINKPKPHFSRIYSRVSKSATRTSVQKLPSVGVFSNTSFYLENVLSIARSRRNESRDNQSAYSLRSKSVTFSQRKEDLVKVSFPSSKDKKNRRNNSTLQNFNFRENELLFLEIGHTSGTNQIIPKEESPRVVAQGNHKEGASYLSQDDLSDGFTAIEKDVSCDPVEKYINRSRCSQYSGKHSSLVVLTEYSSDAEHTLPGRYYYTSNCHGFSDIDNLFESNSIQVNVYPVCQQVPGRPQLPSLNNPLFTFPCN